MPALPNPKHELYAQAVAEGSSAAEAYRKAGYADHRANAHALGQKTDVSQRVAELRERAAVNEAKAVQRAAEKLALTKERVLRGLMNIAFADPRKLMRWNDDGGMILDSSLIDDAEAMAIAEVSFDKDGRPKLKLVDKIAALTLLGRHLAMFKEHVEVTGNLVHDVEADGANIREILIGRFNSIAARSAQNDNAGGDVAEGDGDASVGLADLGSTEPTAA